jgi:hypothetical protein
LILPRELSDALPIPAPLAPGERCLGELPVEYQAPIIDTIPAIPYDADEGIAFHRVAHNAMRVAPPPRPASFVRRSIRRG